jgi:hypothetical protein
MTKLLIVSYRLLPHRYSSQSTRKGMMSHLLTLQCVNTEDDKSFVDLTMFDTEDDCCHYIKKVSTSIQMFSIFIISLIITN